MIHVGDCIEWLECWGDQSIDVMIADPPYSEHTHAKSRAAPSKGIRNPSGLRSERKTIRARDLGFDSITPATIRNFAIEAVRVTRRWILVFCDEQSIGAWRFDLQGAGAEVVRVCPWVKPNCAPQFTGDRPGAGWEAILVAHRTSLRGKPVAKRWNGGGFRGVYVHDVPREAERQSTEKPVSLMLELVDHFTDAGELVVDPFAGRGTTGVACIRAGRMFVGAELDPAMAARAEERLSAEREGHDIFARRAGQSTLFGAAS